MKYAVLLMVFLVACTAPQPIGGQRDEHGCLGPAGYTYNADIDACVREWELQENQKEAAKLAVQSISGVHKGLTVIEVQLLKCPGCFIVKFEMGKDRFDVEISNWKVKSKTLTPDECIAQGGEPLNIVGGAECAEGEVNIGDVTGFISPNICCVPK